MSIAGPLAWRVLGTTVVPSTRQAVSPSVEPTLAPTVDPTAQPPAAAVPTGPGSTLVVTLVLVWAVAAVFAARFLGAFRRRGIIGPERMGGDDSPWSLATILGGGVVAWLLGSIFVASLLSGRRGGHPRELSDWAQLTAGAAGDLIGLAVLLSLLRQRRPDHTGLRPLGLQRHQLPTALAGGTAALFILFPLVLVASVAVSAVYAALHLTPAKQHPVLQMMGADHGPAVMALCVVTAVGIAPLFEETLFRGVLQTLLGRLFTWAGQRLGWAGPALAPTWPPARDAVVVDDPSAPVPGAGWPHTPAAARWAAVGVTSVLFAAIHANAEPAAVFPIFVLSLGLGFVYERSGNLWMSMACHALFNTAEIVLFLKIGGG